MPTPPPDLLKFLKPYDRAIQKLTLQLRAIVIEELAPCYENIYDAYSAVAMGYGSSDRLRDGLCHIAVYTKHVNLGFNHGASLDDPDGLLEGAGKQIRHLTIASEDDLRRPDVRAFLRRAIRLAREDSLKLGESHVTVPTRPRRPRVISTVKAVYKKKRRPS